MSLYSRVARPVLFRLDAETAHERTLRALAAVPAPVRVALRRAYATDDPTTVFGVRFPSRVGLAAGMDKDGVALRAWPALGFGFVEVGTVTWHPQPGNPRPRLVRLPAHGAIVNRMGFNNRGARALAARLARSARLGPPPVQPVPPVPLGISLGKSKVTPVADAVGDYVASLRVLRAYADYVAVNVSSPNTPGLRSLQDAGALRELLGALVAEAHGVPLLVKVAPDLTDGALAEALGVCVDTGVAGVVAVNTTLSRDTLPAGPVDPGPGGLSGRPLTARAREVVAFVRRESGLPVIGVGGIMTPDDAVRLVDAGADLVQLWTGFVYGGPALVRGAARAVLRRCRPGCC